MYLFLETELAEFGLQGVKPKDYNAELLYAYYRHKSAVNDLEEAIFEHSKALSISDRIERLTALRVTSIILPDRIKQKEDTWNRLLLQTVGEKGVQEYQSRQDTWEKEIQYMLGF